MKKILLFGFTPLEALGMRGLVYGDFEVVVIESLSPPDVPADLAIVSAGVGFDILDWMNVSNRATYWPCVVIWGNFPQSLVSLLMRNGAMAILRPGSPVAMIRECIVHVARGYTWTEEDFHPSANVSHVEALSPRELQVLRLVQAGKPNSQIGETLGIAPGIVKDPS